MPWTHNDLAPVIRSFGWKDIFAPRVNNPVILAPVPPPTEVVWEGRADGTYSEEEPSGTLNFKAEWEEDKSKRESKLVKVVNPDDEDQHVFIERVNKFTFRNTKTNREESFKFDWSSPLDGGA